MYKCFAYYSSYTNRNLNLVSLAYEARVPPTPPPQHSLFIFDSPRQGNEFRTTMTVFNSATTKDHYDIWGVLDHSEADNDGDYTSLQQISTAIQVWDRNFATNQKPMNTNNRKWQQNWYQIYSKIVQSSCGPGQSSRYSNSLRARRSWDRAPVEARSSAPTHTSPGAHPVSWVPGLFPAGKAAEAWRWSPTQSKAKVKGKVQLYLYSSSEPSWPVLGWTLRLLLPIVSCLFDQKLHRDTFFCEHLVFPCHYRSTSTSRIHNHLPSSRPKLFNPQIADVANDTVLTL